MRARPIPPHIGNTISYDPLTGQMFRKGQPCGTLMQDGYITLRFEGSRYAAHQVAWFLMTGKCAEVVDHRDLNRSNNIWSNLREATPTLNNANSPRKGRYLKGCTPFGAKFQAQIKCRGKNHYLGLFSTQEEAHAAYLAKAVELFGEFARAA